VQQRTREIGVRIALGADAASVATMVVSHGMGIAVVGIVLGLAVALALAQVLAGMVFGVAPRSPAVFGGIAVLLAAVALAAIAIPALRASRIDPLQTLRAD
jgi:ABC-type antimicrobial peptide transport system permease subunit